MKLRGRKVKVTEIALFQFPSLIFMSADTRQEKTAFFVTVARSWSKEVQSRMKLHYKIYSKKKKISIFPLDGFNHVNKWQGGITTLLKRWMSC